MTPKKRIRKPTTKVVSPKLAFPLRYFKSCQENHLFLVEDITSAIVKVCVYIYIYQLWIFVCIKCPYPSNGNGKNTNSITIFFMV